MQKIFIICGELSGEAHAARVVYELFKLNPRLKIKAMGSSILSEMGAQVVIDYKNYGFSGFTEVLMNLVPIFKLKAKLLEEIMDFQPDLVLGVDYSGLNLEIAASLTRLKSKAKFVQYIAPQLWASRPYRIHKVKANVTKVLCTLDFEEDLYTRHNIPVRYVGNPVVSSMSPSISKAEFLADFAKSTHKEHPRDYYSDTDGVLIGIFPGSRASELHHLLPAFVEAARKLRRRLPSSRFILAKASSISMSCLFEAGLRDNTDHLGNTLIEILEPQMMFNANHKLLSAADLLWLCSGTVTLEAALYAKPHFLSYKGDPLSYFLYRMFRCINMAGLPNIIAGKYIVQEFLQQDASAENFLQESYAWLSPAYLEDPKQVEFSDYYHQTQSELLALRSKLSLRLNTQEIVAQEIIDLLGTNP